MIVEEADSLCAWLKNILEPLSDADPFALAKYVLALLKKNADEEKLRTLMIEQLEVFLLSQTRPFVEKLFTALNTKEYSGTTLDPPVRNPDHHNSKDKLSAKVVSEDTTEDRVQEKTQQEGVTAGADETVTQPVASETRTCSVDPKQEPVVPLPDSTNTAATTMSTSSTSTSSEVEHDDILATKKRDLDEISVNSLEMLKAVMDPSNSNSSSDNESSISSREGIDSRPGRKKERSTSERKRKQSRAERDRKYHGRSRSADQRGQSNSPRMDRTRGRFTSSSNFRNARFRRRPRIVSPRLDRFRRRSRTPPLRHRRLNCSRSRSPVSRKRYRSPLRTISHSRTPPPCDPVFHENKPCVLPLPKTFDVNSQEISDVPPSTSSVLKSVVVVPNSSSHDHGKGVEGCAGMSNSAEVNKCRDFEERGLCLRGELCPFDHGTDPIVLSDIAPSATPGPNVVRGFMSRPRIPSPNNTINNPIVRGDEYFPESPGLEPAVGGWHPPHFRPRNFGFGFMARGRGGMLFRPPNLGPYPLAHGQRQLISVPLGPPPNISPCHFRSPHPPDAVQVGGGPSPSFDHGRLGLRPVRNRLSSSLEVRKIPREQNNIQELNTHFSQFGKIVNIQINHDGDPEAALVTFYSPTEAQKAYRSSEAVLNNRFIKVFWHNGMDIANKSEDEKHLNELSPAACRPRLPVRDRLGYRTQPRMFMMGYPSPVGSSHSLPAMYINHPNTHPPDAVKFPGPVMQQQQVMTKNSPASENNTALNNSSRQDTVPQNLEASNKSQEIGHPKNNLEQKKLEAFKLTNDLRKRLQTMMDEQISNQKKLIAKLESGKLKPEEREETLKVLKSLQNTVEKLAKELSLMNAKVNQPSQKQMEPPLKTKEQIQKEILDTELDLIKQEQNGKDPVDLRQKLVELKSRTKFLQHSGGRGKTLKSSEPDMYRIISNGANLKHDDLDRKQIKVTGFHISQAQKLLDDFSTFGPVRDCAVDPKSSTMVIEYESCDSAVSAFKNGHTFKTSQLNFNVDWVVNEVVKKPKGSPRQFLNVDKNVIKVEGKSAVFMNSMEGEQASNEIHLSTEEDESDDLERERSWRR